MTPPPGDETPLEIKKYPNRRFYDVSRSRHVTLADLYDLVRQGRQILVRDSRTGSDITNVVLTQIILEHDPPKLDLFPASLLHQAIQSNQQMIRSFIEQYFAQAMDAFTRSRNQFDDFLRTSGFSALSPSAPLDWIRMLMPGGDRSPAPAPAQPAPTPGTRNGAASAPDLAGELAELRSELAELKSRGRPRKKSGTRPRADAKPNSSRNRK